MLTLVKDFKGQALAENIYSALLSITSVMTPSHLENRQIIESVRLTIEQVLALVIGYVQNDIYLTLWIGLAGTVLSMFVVVPPWPVFNRNPQPWLGSTAALLSKGVVVDGGAKNR